VLLSSDIVQLQDIVMETSGSEGATSLVDEIAYMINKYKAQYPNGNVPLELAFGTGERDYLNGPTTYKGNASVNTIALTVGNDLVVIQKDQKCEGQNTSSLNACTASGIYRVEATLDSNNNITTTNINATFNNGGSANGSYNASVNNSNGLVISGLFTLNTSSRPVYQWDIDFTNPTNTFSI
ncbi:MAG: hypothetical protein AB1782_16160, partial [Cyanobacteriota bacterium]